MVLPQRHIIPAPHFDLSAKQKPLVREKAG
jgi:hypothetical protein